MQTYINVYIPCINPTRNDSWIPILLNRYPPVYLITRFKIYMYSWKSNGEWNVYNGGGGIYLIEPVNLFELNEIDLNEYTVK